MLFHAFEIVAVSFIFNLIYDAIFQQFSLQRSTPTKELKINKYIIQRMKLGVKVEMMHMMDGFKI